MTTLDIEQPSSAFRNRLSLFAAAVAHALRAFLDSVTAAVDARIEYDRLSRLSDVELASRGLERRDIARQAFAAAHATRAER